MHVAITTDVIYSCACSYNYGVLIIWCTSSLSALWCHRKKLSNYHRRNWYKSVV